MGDPAAVLRAAADLAGHRAKNCPAEHARWISSGPVPSVLGDAEIATTAWWSQAEHIAAADPAFMLTVAAWWRWAVVMSDWSDLSREMSEAILQAALPSALTYLCQENTP